MNWKKVLKGLGIALAGAAITYLAQIIPDISFGVWTPVVVAIASALVNWGREWLKSLGYFAE